MRRHLRSVSRNRVPAAASGFAPPQDIWGVIAQKLGLKQF
jgi:hypothetical protein